jgi:fatty-acyl-CoA synthase
VEFNVAQVMEAVAATCPDRPAVLFHDRHITYEELRDRWRRLANVLRGAGFEVHAERDGLLPHESGQDHLALYLHNGNEYLEGMIGAYAARTVPFNVNYRYVADELGYLLADSRAKGIVYHSRFAPILDEVRRSLPDLQLLLQVADDSRLGLLDGATWYEDALESVDGTLDASVADSWSPDDLYMLYTGGTTGMPKGVLWRQADIFVGALGGRSADGRREFESLDRIREHATNGGARMLPAPPFMHGAAHWMAFTCFTGGSTLVIPSVVDHFDAAEVLATIEEQRVNIVLIVGDAFGRPLVDEVERGEYDASSLLAIVSGGATLSAGIKRRLLEALPSIMVLDGLGASETGAQAGQRTAAGQTASTGTFTPGPDTCTLSESLDAVLAPGHAELGWLGQRGRVPLGYLGDPEKTARTFPVIDGVRYAVPGDRARIREDGTLELYGRDSVTINTGGEKVFAEEVEQALAEHPAVYDVVVCGRPSDRWGNEVVAIVQLAEGATADDEALLAEAQRHLARYKLPKAIVRTDHIERSPSGKADYRWAAGRALEATSQES